MLNLCVTFALTLGKIHRLHPRFRGRRRVVRLGTRAHGRPFAGLSGV